MTMTQDLPAACPFGCGGVLQKELYTGQLIRHFACGTNVGDTEPTDRCTLTLATRRIAEIRKLAESRNTSPKMPIWPDELTAIINGAKTNE